MSASAAPDPGPPNPEAPNPEAPNSEAPNSEAPNPEAPNPQLPVVQRVRIRYAKRGRLRFTSHRDCGRAFERAIRRSGVPVAYSSGYTPHPRISYAGASPTGAASEAEYLEIALARECEPEDLRGRLDAALPDGLDLVGAVTAPESPGPSLSDRLEASAWTIRLDGVGPQVVQEAVRAFWATSSVPVERTTKKGPRTLECKDAVVRLSAAPDPDADQECAILDLVVRHGAPSVRPDDVLAGLRVVAGLEPAAPPRAERTAQGPLDPRDGTVGDPFAPDRDAS